MESKQEVLHFIFYLFPLDADSRSPLGPPETCSSRLPLKTQTNRITFRGFDIRGNIQTQSVVI